MHPSMKRSLATLLVVRIPLFRKKLGSDVQPREAGCLKAYHLVLRDIRYRTDSIQAYKTSSKGPATEKG